MIRHEEIRCRIEDSAKHKAYGERYNAGNSHVEPGKGESSACKFRIQANASLQEVRSV